MPSTPTTTTTTTTTTATPPTTLHQPPSPSPCLSTFRPLLEGEAFAARPSSPARPSAERPRPYTRSGTSYHPHDSRPRSKSHSKSHSNDMVISPEQYNSLPPSIQKKYFSPVERLRIAQASATQKRKKQQVPANQEGCSPPRLSTDSMKPRAARSFNNPSMASLAQKPHCFRAHPRSEADVDEEQALRFLSLPDKIKRLHFTLEELVLLSESSERALGWMSEDGSQRRVTLDRNGSIYSSQYRSSDSEDLSDGMEKDWIEMETDSINSFEYLGEKDMEFLRDYARRRKGSICSTNSAFPQSRNAPRQEPRHRSFSRKRAMPLAPLPLPPPTLRPAVPPLPVFVASSDAHQNGLPPKPASVETTTSTTYYKDTHARQKLRTYLASPERFDEALEFGFPAQQTSAERSISLTSALVPNLHTDLDSLSQSDSRDEDDGRSSVSSPRTPSLVNGSFNSSATTYSSLDSGMVPFALMKGSVRSLSPDIIGGREMTLRMTLTRPDLRAPEEELYAFQRKQVSGVDVETSDPLALQALPVCDDHTGAHGAFAINNKSSSGGGFKKVWKNLRGAY